MEKITELEKLAKKIRLDVLKMTYEKKTGFIGTAFSCADILAVLYGDIVRAEHDIVIMSKGHGAVGWYAALAETGYFDKAKLDSEFNVSGYKMGVHPKRNAYPGIYTSSGSLGQGEGLGCGVALASRIQNKDKRVYVIMGDGECNEGSVWEAFMFAKRYKLDNLVFIIDRNKLQSYGHDSDVLNLDNMTEKVASFGLNTIEVDGHNVEELCRAFGQAELIKDVPTCIVANTIKGKGCSVFEDKVLWHYKWPEKEHLEQALLELGEV